MKKTRNLITNKRCRQCKSLYELGYFDFEQREQTTMLLEPLGISRNRPLIRTEHAVILEVRLSGPVSAGTISNQAVLFASHHNNLNGHSDAFCGWKEKDDRGGENCCLGILDEQVTVAGTYCQCRKSGHHRTLK